MEGDSLIESDRTKVISAVSTAENFTKLYYSNIDKMRHTLNKLYHSEAMLVWNGNQVCGADKIQKYFEDLPISEHTIISMDAHPVGESAVSGQSSLLVTTAGEVTFNNTKRPFQQTFLITVQEDKWKVVSDCFRFQD